MTKLCEEGQTTVVISHSNNLGECILQNNRDNAQENKASLKQVPPLVHNLGKDNGVSG